MRILVIFLLVIASSSVADAKGKMRKPSSSDCSQSGQEPVKHNVKNGQSVELRGFRFDKPYQDTIGCSDGSHGFADYVPVGECLGIPIQDAVGGEYKRHIILCE